MSKPKAKQEFIDPTKGKVFSARFVVAILLFVVGIAWIAYYYTQVRVDPTVIPAPRPAARSSWPTSGLELPDRLRR